MLFFGLFLPELFRLQWINLWFKLFLNVLRVLFQFFPILLSILDIRLLRLFQFSVLTLLFFQYFVVPLRAIYFSQFVLR